MEASTTRIAAGFMAAFALLALNAFVSYTTLGNLVTANHLVANSEQCLRLLVELRASLSDAEAGQRGYLISGDERYLEPYVNARPVVTSRLNELTHLNSDDVERAARLSALEPLVVKRMQQLNDAINARRERGGADTISSAHEVQGKTVMDRIRHMISEIQTREEVMLATRTAEADFNASVSTVTFTVATFLNVCLLAGIGFLTVRATVSRRRTAIVERDFTAKLAESVGELRERNQEVIHLSQMSSFLQTCSSSAEACNAIARFGPLLFPHEAGTIFIFHASRNYLEVAA